MSKLYWLAALCGTTLTALTTGHGNAQTMSQNTRASQDQTLWYAVEQQGVPLPSAYLKWRVESYFEASPTPPEQENQNTEALRQQLQQKGASAEMIDSALQRAKRHADFFSQDRTVVSYHEFRRDGRRLRCDIFSEKGELNAIDYFDGTNAVTTLGFTKSAKGVFIPESGVLQREARTIMPHSAAGFGYMLFMAAGSITSDFPHEQTQISRRDGALCLERDYQGMSIPLRMRLFLYPGEGRPRRLDWFDPSNNRPLLRLTASDAQRWPTGVLYPKRIVMERFDGAGRSHVRDVYTLIEANFGSQLDATEVKVPPGISLIDQRFGNTQPASYRVGPSGQLPTDDEVRALIKQDSGQQDPSRSHAQPQSYNPHGHKANALAWVASLLCLLLGAILWKRSDT